MAWIKMRSELLTHPKIVRILSAMRPHDVQTKTDKFRVIGGLHAVWCIFDQHSEDGVLVGYTPELMDHMIGWEGFSQAMVSVEWLHFDGSQTLVLPEFDEHNSQSAKRRAEDQKRKENGRKKDKCPQSVRNLSADDADEKRTRERVRVREEGTNTSLRTSIVIATASDHDDDWIPKDEAEWLRHLRAKHAFEADPTDISHRKRYWPIFARWVNAGIQAAQVDAAIAKSYAEATEPISNIVAYADRVLATMEVPKKPKEGAWMMTIQSMSAKARELGIADARPGESEAQFKARIINAINERGAA
jgi:hypothetical protein